MIFILALFVLVGLVLTGVWIGLLGKLIWTAMDKVLNELENRG